MMSISRGDVQGQIMQNYLNNFVTREHVVILVIFEQTMRLKVMLWIGHDTS